MDHKRLISRPIIDKYYEDIKYNINLLDKKPGLSIIIVGDRDDSNVYVNIKKQNVMN